MTEAAEIQRSDTPPPSSIESRLARLEASMEFVLTTLIEIKAELRAMRAEFRGDIGAVRTELNGDIGTVRTELKGDLAELRRDARTDFRLLFGAIIATNLGMGGLMAKGFGWL